MAGRLRVQARLLLALVMVVAAAMQVAVAMPVVPATMTNHPAVPMMVVTAAVIMLGLLNQRHIIIRNGGGCRRRDGAGDAHNRHNEGRTKQFAHVLSLHSFHSHEWGVKA